MSPQVQRSDFILTEHSEALLEIRGGCNNRAYSSGLTCSGSGHRYFLVFDFYSSDFIWLMYFPPIKYGQHFWQDNLRFWCHFLTQTSRQEPSVSFTSWNWDRSRNTPLIPAWQDAHVLPSLWPRVFNWVLMTPPPAAWCSRQGHALRAFYRQKPPSTVTVPYRAANTVCPRWNQNTPKHRREWCATPFARFRHNKFRPTPMPNLMRK